MLDLSKGFPVGVRSWLVPALCLLVVGALAAIFLFKVPVGNLLLVLMALACPLSHLLLGHGAHAGASHATAEHNHAEHPHIEHRHALEARQPEPAGPAVLDGGQPETQLARPNSI